MSQAIIKTVNLTRTFGDVRAVNSLNLEIFEGEIFGLVGPDGAGKTTTLRLLCGLLEPTDGSAWVAGYDGAKDAGPLRENIGYMSQRFGLYGDLTVSENIDFYADLFGIPHAEREKSMTDLLKMTRMGPFRKRQARRLSGGMRQKLALMCTLLHRPRILFLDEPTNGVDPVSRRDFWTILYQLVKGGMTVLLTTCYMDEAERCNRVGLIHMGSLILCDFPEHIKGHLKEQCYEIKCKDLRLAREAMLNSNGVLSAEPAGSALHLFICEGPISISDLEQVLAEKGLGPVSSKQITPSLEDMFIAMIRKTSASTQMKCGG